MKNFKYLYVLVTVLFISCSGYEPYSPYVYEVNPHYSFGYVQFYGTFYKELLENPNNVIDVSLFSDSLSITEEGSLEGFGQFLFLEDVFTSPTDSMLQIGTYTISNSGEPFTIAPGVNDTIDNEVYTLGSTISYYEQNSAKSKVKLITEGVLTVSNVGTKNNVTVFSISFDLKTDDGNDLKGSFTNILGFSDESLQPSTLVNHKNKQVKF